MDLEHIWIETLDTLSRQMTKATFNAILLRSQLLSLSPSGEGASIQVPTEMAKDWLENRMIQIVIHALSQQIKQQVKEIIFVLEQPKPAPRCENEIHLRDQRKGNRYGIDREFIFSGYQAVIGAHGSAIYNVLVAHARNDCQECSLYRSTIALEAGVSQSQAKREIKRLEQHHLIDVDRSRPSKANTFLLLDVSEWIL